MVLQTCTGGLTHVRRARVEERVRVGDELQLSVQVGQAGTGKGHAHLTVASHLHAVHVCGHVQRPQSGGDVHLRVGDAGVGGVSGTRAGSGETRWSTHRVLLPLAAEVQGQACGEHTYGLFRLRMSSSRLCN